MICNEPEVHRAPERSAFLSGVGASGSRHLPWPSQESYQPNRKARGAAAFGPPTADAAVSAERVRAALSSTASAPALLHRTLPAGGAEVVAVPRLPVSGFAGSGHFGGPRRCVRYESAIHRTASYARYKRIAALFGLNQGDHRLEPKSAAKNASSPSTRTMTPVLPVRSE